MAGDWIKMRTNLDTDPRVFALSSKTGAHVQHVKGALHWLWSQADTHTTDGKLWGYVPEQVDQTVGIPGFCSALEGLKKAGKPWPWLKIGDGFVQVPDFGKHNGESAKKRAQGALRASRKRHAASARFAHLEQSKSRAEQQQSKRREEKNSEQQGKAGPALPHQASANGFRSAAAASPQDPQTLCRGIWRDQVKADAISLLEGATTERILWLIWRTRTEKPPPRRPQGFIEKGIRAKWDIDPVWLGKYEAERARLNGAPA